MKYGIQMYSVRDITEKNMAGALKALADMGYGMVEFAGFFGIPADEIRGMLAENHLEVSGTHTGIQELTDHLDETIAYHQAIGNKNIYIPWADLNTQAKLDAFVLAVNEIQPKLQAAGINLGYHNHDHEFRPNADGSVIAEQILYRTNLSFEIDTFWAYVGMGDPLLLMDRIRARVPVIHIKDGMKDGSGKPLGMGEAPVADVYKKAVEFGIPMVVESETLTPDGLTEAKICIDCLKAQEQA